MSRGADPFSPFDAWAAKEMRDAKSGVLRLDRTRRFTFTPATTTLYRTIWKGWLTWLAGQDLHWHQATSAEVRRFLAGPTPAPDGVGRNPIHKNKMANYTQQRYWRVLRGVYALAFAGNPARDLSDMADQKPQVQARSRISQVLPPGVLLALRDPERLAGLVPRETSAEWWVARDRAALALLAHCGLSSAELIALQGNDLLLANAVLRPGGDHQASVSALQDAAVPRVNIADGMARTVPIAPAALQCVMPWLQERQQLLCERLGLPGNAPELGRMPLFFTRQADGGPLPAMVATSVYLMVSRYLTAALRDPAVKAAAGPKVRVAKGAAIVRNSVLQHWLWVDKLAPAEVAALAGLKSAESLRIPQPK